MADETVSATTIINAPAEAIFAVLDGNARHAAINGTGWVRESLDSKPPTICSGSLPASSPAPPVACGP